MAWEVLEGCAATGRFSWLGNERLSFPGVGGRPSTPSPCGSTSVVVGLLVLAPPSSIVSSFLLGKEVTNFSTLPGV